MPSFNLLCKVVKSVGIFVPNYEHVVKKPVQYHKDLELISFNKIARVIVGVFTEFLYFLDCSSL